MSTTELTWVKSSYSGSSGDNCVEVAVGHETVHVRDSKDTPRGPLTVSPDAWTAFTGLAADARV
ncbi:DUF397 domain-containing protein [Streptomyces sp. GSL17-111]|uniref:DUF397 domain-containing protein n=1 Tax=Streptomyces sp. GSL17-111 TaxID=3121596 RepID=UPI0030F40F0B